MDLPEPPRQELSFPTGLVSMARSAFFFFNDTATTEISTLSLHDALPISCQFTLYAYIAAPFGRALAAMVSRQASSEEHTSELQSPDHLVCRLLLEKKKDSIGQRINCLISTVPPSVLVVRTRLQVV